MAAAGAQGCRRPCGRPQGSPPTAATIPTAAGSKTPDDPSRAAVGLPARERSAQRVPAPAAPQRHLRQACQLGIDLMHQVRAADRSMGPCRAAAALPPPPPVAPPGSPADRSAPLPPAAPLSRGSVERVCKSWRAAALKVPSSLTVDPAAMDAGRPLRMKAWLANGLRRLAARNVQTLCICSCSAKEVPECMPAELAKRAFAQLRRWAGPLRAWCIVITPPCWCLLRPPRPRDPPAVCAGWSWGAAAACWPSLPCWAAARL